MLNFEYKMLGFYPDNKNDSFTVSYWSNDDSVTDYISDSEFDFNSFKPGINLEFIETDFFLGDLHNGALMF